ncbi:cadherin EGF LAG seven-pass G-type receptor 2 [Patella vulgata]|uniref:cadherin EGF LAG seven-pass G-type receptor 2 n=1 Tax=Patella vulgata TaxID=6465 RepID=UPI0024A83BD4|nr:cadherin EGF LAG seven-pass G-type receptor 2 [Patella vulgata]
MKLVFCVFLVYWNTEVLQTVEVITPGKDILWTLIESTKVGDETETCFTCAEQVTMATIGVGHCSSCFGIWKATAERDFCMHYVGPASLDYDLVKEYRIPVTCKNGSSSDTTNVIVKVTPNTPPYFTQPLSDTVTVSSPLQKFDVIDVDDDQLNFYLLPNPFQDKFKLKQGTKQATLVPTTDLTEVCEDEIVLKVMVSDNFNPPVGPVTTTVVLNNVSPQVTSLNREIQWAENRNFYQYFKGTNVGSAGGTCIITSEPVKYAVDISTFGCGSTITVNPYFHQANGKGYDYEIDPPVNYTIVYQKGKCPSKPVWVYVRWTNVNEKPVLDLNKDAYTAQEGMIDVLPDYTLKDPDAGDTHSYKLVSPKDSAFEIDEHTGRIYSLQYFSVTAESITKTFHVVVTDKAGLESETKTVDITITDANDNFPIVADFTTHAEYTACEDPLPVIQKLNARDSDFGLNGETEFVPVKSAVLSLDAAGVLKLVHSPEDKQFHSINIQAVDKGTPKRYSDIKEFSVIGTPCPTTTPPLTTTLQPSTTELTTLLDTTTPPTTTEPPENNKWWEDPLTLLAVILTLLLGFIIFVLAACCLIRCCGCCSNGGNSIQPQKYQPNNMSSKAAQQTPQNPANAPQPTGTRTDQASKDADTESGFSEGEEFYMDDRGDSGQVVGSSQADAYWKGQDKAFPSTTNF